MLHQDLYWVFRSFILWLMSNQLFVKLSLLCVVAVNHVQQAAKDRFVGQTF